MIHPLSRPYWRPFKHLLKQRAGFLGTTDFFLRGYNGIINRLPFLPWPGKQKPWKVHVKALKKPVYVRQGSKDWSTLNELIFKGEYSSVFEQNLGTVSTVLDLGAHIGLTVRIWLERFPSARVIAVEPDPFNLEICRRNVEASGRAESVSFINACAAVSTGLVYLHRSEDASCYHISTTRSENDLQVEALSMPAILRIGAVEGTIDLLKCDIEGAEAEIFMNCQSWINRIRFLVIELHGAYSVECLLRDLSLAGTKPHLLYRRTKKLSGFEVAFLKLRD